MRGEAARAWPTADAAFEGLGVEDLDLDHTARGGLEGELVAGLVTDDGGTQGSLRGEDLDTQVAAGVARTQQERLLAARNQGSDDHAGLDDAVVGRGLSDLCMLQHFLEGLDAGLVHGLLVARGVVAAVLAQVAFLAGCINEARDLDALDLDALFQLACEQVVLGLREPLCVSHGSSNDVSVIERRHTGAGAHGVECSNIAPGHGRSLAGRRVRNSGPPGRRRRSDRPTPRL